MDYNRVLLGGRLTRNPELRFTPSGTAVCDLGLAVNEKFKNSAGETVERTCFVDVVVWGKQAESCSDYLKRGAPVFVEGRLQLDEWQSKEGEKRARLRVRADRVQFLGQRPSDGGTGQDGANAADSGGGSGSSEDDGEDLPF